MAHGHFQHLANQKASWYQFQLALDIPEAADAPPSFLRNINVPNRESLLIDGNAQSISGVGIEDGPTFEGKFLDIKFLGKPRSDNIEITINEKKPQIVSIQNNTIRVINWRKDYSFLDSHKELVQTQENLE